MTMDNSCRRNISARQGVVIIRETMLMENGEELRTSETLTPNRARVFAKYLIQCANFADEQMPSFPELESKPQRKPFKPWWQI
jgi:hypothetical protein